MLRFLPPLFWTGLIAYFGGDQWGEAETADWLGPLLSALLPIASPEELAIMHRLIRKAAHVIEYAVLALLWRRSVGGTWGPLGLAVLTASLDEFCQSFTPGRDASVADAFLDGAAAAMALALMAGRGRRQAAGS